MTKGFRAVACALLAWVSVLGAGWPAYGWAGGTGVSFWIEPAEQMVSIFFIQGGQAAVARTAFENAVRQAIVN